MGPIFQDLLKIKQMEIQLNKCDITESGAADGTNALGSESYMTELPWKKLWRSYAPFDYYFWYTLCAPLPFV